ncbi:MAG: alpha/beta hydrolase [Acidobacteria bacterium]|nr:alpha/beta hydrolase [Acidobacteriota bacterium]
MHRHDVHLGSRTLSYLDSSPDAADARVAVLIHAFPLAAAMWEPQLETAPPGWRFITPDLGGFGGSPLVDGDGEPSIDDYAADVIDLLSALGIEHAVVGGLSMGGYVTFAVLRRAPALIEGLVLADTKAGADSPEARANRQHMLALLDRGGPPAIAREMLPKLLGSASRRERPDLEDRVRRLIEQQSAPAIQRAIARLMDRPDATPQLAGVQVPTLVIVGSEDHVTPVAEAQRIADAIPGATLVVIANAGHLSSLECADEFGAVLSTFLSRL